jgi:DNA-binding transcriptional LysR family regulator
VANGWETELTIGMDSIFSSSTLIDEVIEFCQVADLTRLKFYEEVLSGTWESLLDRRVDLLVGAVGEGPSGGGYTTHLIGSMPFVFVVSPKHPLAGVNKPLGKAELSQYLAIAVSDSVRKLQPRTVGLLFGQNTLSVPNMRTKYEYQLAGVGFGFLPEPIAHAAINTGLLIVKEVEEPRVPEPLYLSWRTGEEGKALNWWIDKMKKPDLLEKLWSSFK